MKTHFSDQDIWIGLVGVVPRPGIDVLGDVKGAYVNILVLASDGADYRNQAIRAMNDLGLEVTEFEDVECLAERLRRHTVDQALLDLADDVRAKGIPAFGTFHAFEDDD